MHCSPVARGSLGDPGIASRMVCSWCAVHACCLWYTESLHAGALHLWGLGMSGAACLVSCWQGALLASVGFRGCVRTFSQYSLRVCCSARARAPRPVQRRFAARCNACTPLVRMAQGVGRTSDIVPFWSLWVSIVLFTGCNVCPPSLPI